MKKTRHLLLLTMGFMVTGIYFSCTPKTMVKTTDKPPEIMVEKPAPPTSLPISTDNRTIPMEKTVRTGQLENGMKYFIRKNSKPENRVELRLALHAGAMQEDEDQRGLAHFIEHMAFNGSANFKKNELVDYLESVGTRFGPDLNAYTSFDETVYMLQVRTDDKEMMDKGMLVIEDWSGAITFDHEEIDKERGVVESEWRSGLSPQQRIFNAWFPKVYEGSRYSERLPIGKPEIIKHASYATIKRFYKDWYRPDLMAIIVVGDIDVDEMEADIKRRFSKRKVVDNPRKKEVATVPFHKETIVSINSDVEAPFSNVQLMYKHRHNKMKTMADYRDNLKRRLYNAMLSARLDELSSLPDPPFSFAYTGYSKDIGDIDTYSSYAATPEGGTLKGLRTILIENERVLRHGFQASEMKRQKAEMLTRMERAVKEKDKTDSGRLTRRYVYHFLNENPIPDIEDELKFYKELLPTIKVEEVNLLAKEWITNENRVVVLTGPKKEESPMPSEMEVRGLLDAVKTFDIKPYVDDTSDEPFIKNIPAPAKIVSERKIEAVDVTELLLENGVKVVLKPTTFKNDEILFTGSSPGGTSIYSDEDYESARAAASIIDESGIGNFSLTQLQKKLTGTNLSISPYISELYEGMNGSTSGKDLETMLQLVYLYFTAPRKDADALKSYVSKQKSTYANLLSQPDYYFYDQVSKIQYDNHPRRGFPTAAGMDKIDLEKVHRIYKDRFADASDFTFTMVGNFDCEKIKPMLATYLGNLPSKKRVETFKDIGANHPNGSIEKELKKGAAPKSQINMMFHGDFEWTPKNRYTFNSLISILRIKMRESMREDIGGVYGVGVRGSASQFPKPNYTITISFNADPPMVDQLIEQALKDIATAKEIGALEKDMEKVKETQRQGRIKDLKENRFWSRQLNNAYRQGLDPEGLTMESYEKAINELTIEDIKAAANLYFDKKRFVKVVLMPESQTEN